VVDPGNDGGVADKDLLAEAAAELYANDPAEFTRRRAALAAGARTAGDKAAATAITALRKPTRSAWLVNRLVRDDPAVPSRLAALAADLRSAGRALDGARIRELSRARRDLVSELTRRALGGADQSSAAPALREQVSATFGAALADPEVAGEVASGTLLKPVGQAGFGFDAALAAVPEPAVPGRAEQEPAEQEPAEHEPAEHQPAEHEPAEVPRGKAATTRRRSAGTEKARAKRAGEKHARAQEERARAEAEREQARIDRENARADRERARAERQRRRQELAAAEQALRDADRAAEEAAGAERRRAGAVGRAEQQLAEERRRLAAAKTRSREAAKAQRDARKALDRLRKLPPPGPLRPV